MKYSFLGGTDLLLSNIGLGTAELGMPYANQPMPSYTEAARLLNFALDKGINFIDTARTYGTSESVIGQALETRRGEYYLCTKIKPIPSDISYKALCSHIAQSIADSLQALRTDHLDLVYFHNATANVAIYIDATDYLRGLDVTRYIGASVYGHSDALAVLRNLDIDVIQVGYSIVDRRIADDVLYLAQQSEIGVIARSVLLGGMLVAKTIPESLADLARAIVELRGIAQAHGMSLLEMAYRYVLDKTPFLIGARNINELQLALTHTRRGPLNISAYSGHNLTRMIERVIIPSVEQLELGIGD